MGTSTGWSAERRNRQSERIRRVKPWERSTGPKTEEGKFISSQNARKYPEVISPHFEVLMKVSAANRRLVKGWSAHPLLTRVERAISIEEALEISRKLNALEDE